MKTKNIVQFHRHAKIFLHLSLGFFIFMGLFGFKIRSGQAQDENPPELPAGPSTPAPGIFGVEMDLITAEGGLEQMAQANAYWVRRNALVWADVQPTESGALDWSTVSGLDAELMDASERGMQVILIVRGTPSWAQQIPGAACGPILANKIAAFATFMHAAVERYSASPFNVKYWELWNEPDIAPNPSLYDGFYGCWGVEDDPYYGGGYYAEMLKAVYPQVKAADPQAQVLLGGLLLDCDAGRVCPGDTAPKFLEGVLRFENNTGKNYFDGISFHAYDYYAGSLGQYSNSNWDSAWNSTGPVHLEKAGFIRNLLSTYGVSGKYLINSESSLLCMSESGCDSAFETTKAYYLAQSYAAAIAGGLRANIWYSARADWRSTALLAPGLDPTQAYYAFKFAQLELNNSTYLYQLAEYENVMGYVFKKSDRRVWILWSRDGGTHPITLPETPLAIYDVDGTPQTASASLTISVEPLYIELPSTYLYIPLAMTAPTIANGNFEAGTDQGGNPAGWTLTNANLPAGLITSNPTGDPDIPIGDFSLLLGKTDYICPLSTLPIGYAAAEQSIRVPNISDGSSLHLTFNYVVYSQDASTDAIYDRFEVYINGQLVFWDGNQVDDVPLDLCTNWRVPGPEPENMRGGQIGGWATASINLAAYKGQTIQLSFQNHNRSDGYYNTYTYIDNVDVVIGN